MDNRKISKRQQKETSAKSGDSIILIRALCEKKELSSSYLL